MNRAQRLRASALFAGVGAAMLAVASTAALSALDARGRDVLALRRGVAALRADLDALRARLAGLEGRRP